MSKLGRFGGRLNNKLWNVCRRPRRPRARATRLADFYFHFGNFLSHLAIYFRQKLPKELLAICK